MPTFLSDETLPIYSSTNEILDLDPDQQFDLANKRATGGTIRCVTSDPLNEVYESSTSSTHESDASEITPMTTTQQNGSIQKGIRDGKTDGSNQDHNDSPSTSEGGALPYRSKPLPENTMNESSYPTKQDTLAKALATSDQDSHHETRPHAKTVDGYLPQLTSIPSENELEKKEQEPQTPSRSPTDVAPRSSPHRYSSPPVYQPGAAASAASGSGHLHPPPPNTLRHRHTLEVPKLNRISGDLDSATASGRFSPTPGSTPRRPSMGLSGRMGRSTYSDIARDEIVVDEETMRWQATIRQKRASKRKRREEQDDDRVLVGTKVDETHANWVAAYNMLTGIRVAVSRTNAKLDREVTDADFDAKQKSTFDV